MKEPKIIKQIKKAPPLVEGAIGVGIIVVPTDPITDVVGIGLVADASRKTKTGKRVLKNVRRLM